MKDPRKNFEYLLAHPRMATISPEEAAALPQFTRHFNRGEVGVIPIKGMLSSGLFAWHGQSYAQVQSVLEKWEDDPEIKSVAMSFDSPGG